MSDTSPGSDWWLASDGKWYPPHLHPDVLNAADQPESTADQSAAVVDQSTADQSTADQSAAVVDQPEMTEDPVGAVVDPSVEAPTRQPIDWDRVAAEREARRRHEETRHRVRVAAAVLVGLGALALLIWAARNRGDDDSGGRTPDTTTTVSSETDTTTTVAETTTSNAPGVTSVSVFNLQPGMCIDNAELSTGLVTDLTAVACDAPHSHEVYYKVTYTPPDGAFDAARVAEFADQQCSDAFATYVGTPYDRSIYYFLHLAPSAESWEEQGDRDIVCLLFQQGATLTGSAAGTAQ